MGRQKERMIEAMYAPYLTDDAKRVCVECFSDPYIKEFVLNNANSDRCHYCENETQDGECNSAPANDVLKYIEACVHKKYTDFENVAMSGDPSGLDAHELINELGILSDLDSPFREELEIRLGRDDDKKWLARTYYNENSQHDVYVKSWEGFKDLVKQKSRFVFGQIVLDTAGMDYWDQQIDPYRILKWLHGMVAAFNLVAELPVGTEMIRVRADTDRLYSTLDQLGPVPMRLAKYANRMSPPGIPMFYSAEDADTAIKEIWNGKVGVKFSVATFKSRKPCLIVDFCSLPPVPTIFKLDATLDQIDALNFLWSFVRDISQPISKLEAEHIQYVPTQILTEYFRHIFKTSDGRPIMGMKYPSSYTVRPCYVMFWGHNKDSAVNPEVIDIWCDLPSIQYRQIHTNKRPHISLPQKLDADNQERETQLDHLVYQLYNLTPEVDYATS